MQERPPTLSPLLLTCVLLILLVSVSSVPSRHALAQDVSYNPEWEKVFTNIGCTAGLMQVGQDSVGNTYIVGTHRPTVEPCQTGIFADENVFVLKLDATGNQVWLKSIGGSDQERLEQFFVTPEGNIYLSGATYSADFPLKNPAFSSTSQNNSFLVGLTANGEQTFGTYLPNSSFGFGETSSTQGLVADNGNVYVEQMFYSSDRTAGYLFHFDDVGVYKNQVQVTSIFDLGRLAIDGQFVYLLKGTELKYVNKLTLSAELTVNTETPLIDVAINQNGNIVVYGRSDSVHFDLIGYNQSGQQLYQYNAYTSFGVSPSISYLSIDADDTIYFLDRPTIWIYAPSGTSLSSVGIMYSTPGRRQLSYALGADHSITTVSNTELNEGNSLVVNRYVRTDTSPTVTPTLTATSTSPPEATPTNTQTPSDTTSPAAIVDLSSTPGIHSGEVTLYWTAPGDDGTGGGHAADYDLRYSDTPITESTWGSARQVIGEPTPPFPGSNQFMTVSGLTTGKRWYFAIKTADEASNWALLSNDPSVQDTGLRPNPNGYQFANYSSIFTLPDRTTDFTIDDMRRMFGDSAVCLKVVLGQCIPKLAAVQWNAEVNLGMLGGHCDGMALTSLRFFKYRDESSVFGSDSTHGLVLSKTLRQHIAYYHAEQSANPVASYKDQVKQKPLSEILKLLQTALAGNADNPTTLFVRKIGKDGRIAGHAITPYAIQEIGSNIWWIWVYDSNHPDDANRHVTINTIAMSWNYDMGGEVYQGDENTDTLGIVPISIYAAQPECPWCTARQSSSDSQESQVWLHGQGHLLITDAQGHRIGYTGTQFVNEIPDAYGNVTDGGIGITTEPIYSLPALDNHTILLDGQTLTQTEIVNVTQFGPGYAASIDDVMLSSTSLDKLTIVPDGKQIIYYASEAKAPTLTLALDSTNESYQFQIKEADLGSEEVVTTTIDTDSGSLVFNNANTDGGNYDLEVAHVNGTAKQKFFHTNLRISAGDTHYIDYRTWSESGVMILSIDRGSDGSIDQEVILSNQANQTNTVYLPLVQQTKT